MVQKKNILPKYTSELATSDIPQHSSINISFINPTPSKIWYTKLKQNVCDLQGSMLSTTTGKMLTNIIKNQFNYSLTMKIIQFIFKGS